MPEAPGFHPHGSTAGPPAAALGPARRASRSGVVVRRRAGGRRTEEGRPGARGARRRARDDFRSHTDCFSSRPAAAARPRPSLPRAGRRGLGDEPLPAELLAGLGEGDVGRRKDELGRLEVVVVERLALAAHEVQQLLEPRVEAGLVEGRDGADDGVVELVEPRVVAVVEPVLALVGDPDDHCWPPSPSCLDCPPEPWPSSAFILASSSSTSLDELSCASWRSMSSWPGPSAVRSSNVPAASSSETASARARICSVLSCARCMARPTSAICSPTPVAASEIRTCASAAEYWALMTSFLVRKASIFWRSLASESVSFCCWASSSVTCWSSDCSSVCATFLRSSAVRASSSLPAASAWRACVSSFTTDCSSFWDCICRRFFAVTTSAMPFLTFCNDSSWRW